MDRDVVVAWAEREREKCAGCGVPRSQVVGSDGTPIEPSPLAPALWSCPACAMLEKHHEQVGKSETGLRPGQSVVLLPRDTVAALEESW